jgi:hypothetical protein
VLGSVVARPGAAICCRAPRGGASPGRVVGGPGKCQSHGKRVACVAGSTYESVCGGCTADGSCAPDVRGRWLFTGVETRTCVPESAPTCGPGSNPPPRIVTSVVDLAQTGTLVTAAWDESGAFWPTDGTINEHGGFTVERPDVPLLGCTKRERFEAASVDDGSGWSDGSSGFSGACEGGVGGVEWHGRLTRLNAVCGNGVVDAGETCDPTVTPPGCAVGGACLPDCRCIVAGLPACGDGTWSAFEACDASATPSGCAAGESCTACERCDPAP